MAGHITDHDARASLPQAEEIVEVSPDALGGNDACGNLRLGRDDVAWRQQFHLELVRQLHLAREPLLLDGCPNESSVLDCRSDLRRDRGDELLVARGEL